MVIGTVPVPVVGALTVSPEGVWGHGRAVWAAPSPLGTAVVTTTGVFVLDELGSQPRRIDTFDQSTQLVSAALSPDGSRLAIAFDSPTTVRQYDVVAGTISAEDELPPEMSVRSLSIRSSDGALLADTSLGLVEWLDPAPAPPRFPIELALAGESAVLPDGTTITPLLGTTEILVARNGSNERVPLTVPDGTTVLDAKPSPDGTVLGVTVGDGENVFERSDTILVLDAATFERRGSIDTGRAIDAHAWSVGDGAVAVAEAASLSVWTLDGVVAGGGSLEVPITSIHPAQGGFVTSGRDGQIVIWADGSWTPTTIDAGGVTLRHVDLGSSGALVTTVDFYGEITTWKIGDQMVSNSDEQFAVGESMGVAIGADRSVAASFTSGRVVVLDQDFVELWSFQAAASNRRVDAVAINPETGTLATGLAERIGDLAFDDTVTSWDVTRRAALFSHGGEGEDVGGCSFFNARVRFTPDGALLATASHDFSITVADATTGATLHELSGPSTILDLRFSPDGESMVASYDDATVNVWDTSDFALVSTYRAAGAYFAFGVLPDGETMVVVDILGAVSIVDMLDGSTVMALGGGTYRTSALAISPDGALVAVPTADGTIAFWSTATGNQLVTDARHAAPVTDLAFGPDGSWLVSSSRDGTVRGWRVAAPG